MARPAMRTFLFSDLRDYTAFIETKGDAAATKMLRSSRRIVRDAVAHHRGAEIKTEGDSFYVVFRSPSAALRCAVDIQRASEVHTTRHPESPVRMGIGINTGEAVPHDHGYVGSAVIVANRLSTAARAGQILVTDTVRSLARTGAQASMGDLGGWTLKGIAQPVHVYEVETAGASPAPTLGPALPIPAVLATPVSAPGLVVCPELVQREGALEALAYHLDAAAKGEARIVAVSGEGGIGKSRLVREIAHRAHGDGRYVFGGRSHPSGQPYEPVIAALRPYAHARGTEILRRVLGALAAELRRLLPEFDIGRGALEVDIPVEERRDRFVRVIDLLLQDAIGQRPVLLVLEDFHDADEATRDLVHYLASSFRGGLCVILTYREEEIDPAHPLRALLAELDRERRLARVVLAPLDLGGVERMTAALLPGRDPTALARAVFERSEGVPFYVEELLKTALDDPHARPDALALPRTIADSVQVRVSRLVGERGPGIADLLEAAAIAEVPLGYDALIRLSDRDESEAGADLAAAIHAQLLERPPTRSELYQFRHALTREALVAGIPPARKRRLHARVARAIEAESGPSARAALLARHFAAAGDRAKALTYARLGAANAIRLGAYPAAIDLLREAGAMATGTSDEAEVLEELVDALQAAGRAAEAEQILARARDLARLSGDAGRLARLDTRLAAVLRMQGRRPDAMSAVQRAVLALEARPGPQLAEALAMQAELAWAEHDATATAELSRRALALARDSTDHRVRVRSLTTLGAASERLGDRTGRQQLDEAIRVGTAAGLVPEVSNAYLELSRALQLTGDWEGARSAAQRGADLAREHGLAFAGADLLAQVAFLSITLGRYRDARAAAERSVATAAPGTTAAIFAKAMLADALTMLGEHSAALILHEELSPLVDRAEPDRQVFMLAARARALLASGRTDEAWECVHRAMDLAGTRIRGVTAFLIAAEVAEAFGDPELVRQLIADLDERFRGIDTPTIRVLRAELQAILAAATGQDTSDAFAAVARDLVDLGVPVRALYRRATSAIARLGHPAESAGARSEIERIRTELAERGALRYIGLIDAAVEASPAKGPWTVRGEVGESSRAASLPG